MPKAELSLRCLNVAKSFSRHAALVDVNVALEGGQIVLLLGANGSGKSTLLRIAAQLLRPDAGSCKVFSAERELKAQAIGYVGHQAMLYGDLSLEENLELFSSLGGGDVRAAIDYWDLAGIAHFSVSSLSKGQLARASLARALLPSPPVLLLDEPTSALDEKSVTALMRHASNMKERGGLVLIATHDIARLVPFAQRILVLHEGRVACDEALGLGGSSQKALPLYQSINR